MEDPFFDDPKMADPDANNIAIKYKWDDEFQRHIAALMISDRQFLLESLDIVKPGYFTNKAHAKVVSIVSEFFKKYRILPRKDFIQQELKSDMKENKSLPYYLGEVNVLYDYFQPGMEAREYLRDKITYFAKIQSIREAFNKSLELIDKSPENEKTWDQVYDTMRKAMTTHQNFEVGVDYFKSSKDRYAAKAEEVDDKDRFILGLPGVDEQVSGGGYCRGEIVSIVAGSGVGKSVMLANIAATNILRSKKGVYISLELAENKIADRMDAIFTGLPVQNLISYKDEIIEKITSFKQVMYDGEIWPLVIKQFPAGTATVNTIRAYVSQLRFHGFDPDFIIVDYVGEMANHSDLKIHESKEKIVRELRALATEEDVFIATAMQPNRDAKKKDGKGDHGLIDDEHLADSYGQIRPLDCCLSLNQNDNEKKLGIGRCYVIKQRDGESRYVIYLKFDKESLKIYEIKQREYISAMNAQKEMLNDSVTMDMIDDKIIENTVKSGWNPGNNEDMKDIDDVLTENINSPYGEDEGSTT